MKTRRREFLQSATALAGGIILVGGKAFSKNSYGGISGLIKIEEPFHGAVLNRNYGTEVDGGLKVRVLGEAPLQSNVKVNGTPAMREGTKFMSEVILRDKVTKITAMSEGWFGHNEHSVRVVWDKNSFPRYRFFIDDNIFCFRDIAQNKYRSLFDCFYLNGLRNLNRKYGTKFVLNMYYTDGMEYTSNKKEFLITQFPDRYKSEWKDNADWLKLAFHAWSNKPDRPYQYASPQKLISDMDKVAEQVNRFAGEETYSPLTVIHWGMVQPAALKLLSERGVRTLSGFHETGGRYDVNYFLDNNKSEYIIRNDAFMDFETGIVFMKSDLVCNNTSIDQIEPKLDLLVQDPKRSEIMNLATHEQYFWPFYSNYVPDHFQRLDKAISWVTDHGYKPVFLHEGFLGAPE